MPRSISWRVATWRSSSRAEARLELVVALLASAGGAGCGGDSSNPFDDGNGAGSSGGAGGLAATTGGAGGLAGITGGTGAGGIVGATGGTGAGGIAGTTGTGGTGGLPMATGGASPGVPPDLSYTFAPLTVAAGQEVANTLCQSWTVGNDQPINVNRIVATNRGGLHHSNWIWVPENLYTGPDGTWNCADRGFDQIIAGAQGGVFFAQSTQSLTDTQAFPPGVAFQMPARVRIIGDVHLMNTTTEDIETDVHFDVYTIEQSEVVVPLQPMAFTNLALDIVPQGQTEAFMQCATPQPDFDVYYVLPHYHELGTSMRIVIAGGATSGVPIYDAAPSYAEPWGQSYDPPFTVRGATGIGISCFYDNPRAEIVGYGTGDQEMCVALLYTSGRKAGGMANLNLSVTDTGGVHRTDGLCLSVGQ